jgi:hypothetical protein
MNHNLIKFIAKENEKRKMFKEKLATIPVNLHDSNWIIKSLESNLSPENLFCDGEISRSQAQAKKRYFLAVHLELEELIGHEIPLSY